MNPLMPSLNQLFDKVLAIPGVAELLKPTCERSAVDAFKNFADLVAEIRAQLSPDTPVEVWFQDETSARRIVHTASTVTCTESRFHG